jgi:hypothetical protein
MRLKMGRTTDRHAKLGAPRLTPGGLRTVSSKSPARAILYRDPAGIGDPPRPEETDAGHRSETVVSIGSAS